MWVVTNKRQIKEEESVGMNVSFSMMGAQRSASYSVEGNTDIQETDMYQIEIYDPEGVLLGTIPIDKFADDIHIAKDRVFIQDRLRGMQYYVYKIIENN